MSKLTLVEQTAASVSTPATGEVSIFADSADSDIKQKDSTGTVTSLAGGGGGGGETNTASNVNTAGVGVFEAKAGVDLQFRGVNAGSSKVSVALDAGNNEIDVDVVEGNLSLANIGGALANDAAHGARGGGTQHAVATTSIAGFQSASDKTKLDGIEAGADVTDATNVAAAGALMADGSVALTGDLSAGGQKITNLETGTFSAEFDNGNSGVADTITWTAAQKQRSTLTANTTFTFVAPSGPANLMLKLIQDATGGRTVTWPAAVLWPGGAPPVLSAGANAIDIVALYYDGTNYFGVTSLNFL